MGKRHGGDRKFTPLRTVRNKMATQYHGDVRKHIAETNQIVEPLIKKLGLKEGVPARPNDRRSGTEG